VVRRSTRILLEVLIGFLAGLALLSGVTVWRLSQDPLELNFLTPYLEQALTGEESGFSAEVGSTVLTWSGISRTLDLRARQVRLRDSQDFTVATLPEVSINLSLRALAQGVVAPTEIDIIGARVTLIRDRDGGFDFGQDETARESAGATSPEADFSRAVPALIAELLSEPDPARPLSFLKMARFLQGELTIYDRKLRTFWHAPTADVSIKRETGGLTGNMDLTLALGATPTDLGLSILYREADGTTILAASFDDLRIETFAALDARLAVLSGFDLPVAGSASAVLEADGRFRSLTFDVTGGPGAVSLPEALAETLMVRQLALRGHLDGATERLELETAEIEFAPSATATGEVGPRLAVTGSAGVVEGDVEVDVTGTASNLPAAELGRYWPRNLAPGARDWVTENIAAGLAEQAEITASLRLPGGDFEAIEVESLSGGYQFRGLDVYYLRPMPPVSGVSGSARFDRDLMTFEVAGGRLGEIAVPEGRIAIDFAPEDETIDLDLVAEGPLRSALELLDHERLDLLSRLGVDPADSRGQATAELGFRFPLIRDLGFEHLKVAVSAKLAEVGLRQVAFGRDATNGELSLELDNDSMSIEGPVELGGFPGDLHWRENFRDDGAARSIVELRVARLTETELAGLGLDLRPYLAGSVSASLLLTRHTEDSSFLAAALDMTGAELALPFLRWDKPPGDEGRLNLGVQLAGERPVALEHMEVSAGGLAAVGRGTFDEAGTGLTRLELDSLRFGGSDLSQVTVLWQGDEVRIDLGDGVFDAAPFTEVEGEGPEPAEEEDSSTALKLTARRLEKVSFGDGRYLENVAVKLDRRLRGWEEIDLRATIPTALWTEIEPGARPEGAQRRRSAGRTAGRGDEALIEQQEEAAEAAGAAEIAATQVLQRPGTRLFRLRYRPVSSGGYKLDARSNDMGALLRALDLRDTVRGGQLKITGHSKGPIPKHSLEARIEAIDFAMVKAPTLAKILTVASLTGLMDTLAGKGIWFDSLTGDFTLADGLLRSDLLHAHGSALGVTAKGEVDLDNAQLDLEGTVVPAYAVNRVLGAIPGLGFILTGGEGGGFLAFTYEMAGPIDEPEVVVNALSALAPGFLRGLFGGIEGENATVFPEGRDR
jgi:uncharacterized protein YhdP